MNKPRHDWTRAAELYDASCCDLEIARQIGCSHTAVGVWRGRTKRPRLPGIQGGGQKTGITSHKKLPQILKLLSSGHSFSTAGAKLGMTRNAISGALQREKLRAQS